MPSAAGERPYSSSQKDATWCVDQYPVQLNVPFASHALARSIFAGRGTIITATMPFIPSMPIVISW